MVRYRAVSMCVIYVTKQNKSNVDWSYSTNLGGRHSNFVTKSLKKRCFVHDSNWTVNHPYDSAFCALRGLFACAIFILSIF